MKPPLRASAALVVVAALAWHALSVTTRVSAPVVASREFATVHYAARVAAMGGDPYDAAQVRAEARRDGTRTVVAPLRAPPPALLLGAWSVGVPRETGWPIMVAVQAVAVAVAGLVLASWWRPLGPVAFALAVVLASAASPAPLTIAAGGGAGVALLVALGAGRLVSLGWLAAAGALLGLGCTLDPRLGALLVPFVLRREPRLFLAAAGGVVAGHAAVLPLAGPQLLRWYWQAVAPRHLLGDAAGVVQPFVQGGNHALVSLLGLPGESLPVGVAVAQLAGLSAGVFAIAWGFRRATSDPVAQVARLGSILVFTLLFGVFTTEGDLVLALPAAVAVAVAVAYGALSSRWIGPVAVALGAFAYPAADIRGLGDALFPAGSPALLPFHQSAELSLLVLLAAALRAGNATVPEPPPEPAPEGVPA